MLLNKVFRPAAGVASGQACRGSAVGGVCEREEPLETKGDGGRDSEGALQPAAFPEQLSLCVPGPGDLLHVSPSQALSVFMPDS